MNRNLLLWTVVVFFFGNIVFAVIRDLTADESPAVTIVLALAAFGVIVAGLTLFVKWLDRDRS